MRTLHSPEEQFVAVTEEPTELATVYDDVPPTAIRNPTTSGSVNSGEADPPMHEQQQLDYRLEDSNIPSWKPVNVDSWEPRLVSSSSGSSSDAETAASSPPAQPAAVKARGSVQPPKKRPPTRPAQPKPRVTDGFDFLLWGNAWVAYHATHGTVNVTHIVKAVGLPRTILMTPEIKDLQSERIIVRGSRKIQGTFLSYKDAISACEVLEIDWSFLDALRQ